MLHRRLVRSGLVLVLLAAAPGVLAGEPAPAPQPQPQPERKGVVGVDLGLTSHNPARSSNFALAPILFGRYRIMENLDIAASWGFSYLSGTSAAGQDSSDFAAGNPVVVGHYTLSDGPGLTITAGVGIGIPVADKPATLTTLPGSRTLNLWVAPAIRGHIADPHWLANTTSILIPLHGEVRFTNKLQLQVDAGLKVFVPSGGVADRETGFGLDFALDVAYRGGPYVPGIRFSGDVVFSGDWVVLGEDEFQSALTPYFQIRFVKGFAEIGFTMNLDDPLGFAFDEDGVWGLAIKGGYYL